jgi:acetolactate decarboxylase
VGTLREHGDLGLGTFEDLDGEMIVIDGQFFQVRTDGSVRECGDDVLSPFAVVTQFAPETKVSLPEASSGRNSPERVASANSGARVGPTHEWH